MRFIHAYACLVSSCLQSADMRKRQQHRLEVDLERSTSSSDGSSTDVELLTSCMHVCRALRRGTIACRVRLCFVDACVMRLDREIQQPVYAWSVESVKSEHGSDRLYQC